jgi:hypothetical protein
MQEFHLNRHKYNVQPVGGLTSIKKNEYRDENGIIWIKRGFFQSLLHNPFKYDVFETYDLKKQDSSEVKILKSDKRLVKFEPSSFNYYSSLRFPVRHFFADVLPEFIFSYHI